MHTQRTLTPPPAAVADVGEIRVDGLRRTHWTLAVCPHCEHELARAERCSAPCPGCGAPLRQFSLYRSTTAIGAS